MTIWILALIVLALLGGTGERRGGCYRPKTFRPGPGAGPPPPCH